MKALLVDVDRLDSPINQIKIQLLGFPGPNADANVTAEFPEFWISPFMLLEIGIEIVGYVKQVEAIGDTAPDGAASALPQKG